MLISKRRSIGLKYFNDPKAFIEHSNDMGNIYKNIEECNPNKKRKVLRVFDDVIADTISNKILQQIATELFTRGTKLNISLYFIAQSFLVLPKNIRLNYRHYLIMKIPVKPELQQIAFNH